MDQTWLPPAKRRRQNACVGSLETVDLIGDEPAHSLSNSCVTESSAEDLDELKEFQVLDEVGSDGPDNVREADTDDSEVPAGDIEHMLGESPPEDLRDPLNEEEFVMKHKTVLDVKGQQYLEVLPLDWVMATHMSGIPVYLHKGLRVCTLSRPYFLGEGSVRRHEIPLSAIPCLAYRRALDEEEKQQKELSKTCYEELNKTNANPETTCPLNGSEPKDTSVEEVDYSIDITGDIATIRPSIDKMFCKGSSGRPAIDEATHMSSGGRTQKKMDHMITLKGPSKNVSNSSCGGSTQDEMDHSSGSTNNETAARECNEETPVSDEAAKSPDVAISSGTKPGMLPGGLLLPATRVVVDKWSNHTLTHEQVTEYCRKLFIFKDISYKFFKDWAQRRQYLKDRKAIQRPKLPVGPKLISLPFPDTNGKTTGQGVWTGKEPRQWILNMNERSYVNMLYEYLIHVMHKTPKYEFRDLENSVTPFEATVLIEGIRYGIGQGSSKKQAKLNAAKETMLILVPEIKNQIEGGRDAKRLREESNMEFFDMIGVEDPRLTDFCRTAVEPLPRTILGNCVRQNFGADGAELQYKWTKMACNKIEYHMSVGKHTAKVVCKSQKIGKQLASQALLQALHPQIKCYGSLLRLYGTQSSKGYREHRREELDPDEPRDCQPNYALLEKLRRDIENLGKRDAIAMPIGSLVLSDCPPSLSGSALNDVTF